MNSTRFNGRVMSIYDTFIQNASSSDVVAKCQFYLHLPTLFMTFYDLVLHELFGHWYSRYVFAAYNSFLLYKLQHPLCPIQIWKVRIRSG
jgi:hypothetical protein